MTDDRPPNRMGLAGRPAFGDFVDLAVKALESSSEERVPGGEDIQRTCIGLGRVVAVLGQYVQDPPRNVALFPAQKQPLSAAWQGARDDARHALLQASAWLCPSAGAQSPVVGGSHPGWLAHGLSRSAQALTAGRDLLFTHFAQSPEGTWQPRSEWAEVVASPQATRAVLVEVARVAGTIAPRGTRVALTPGWRGSPRAREKLTKACQWLWTLHASVQAADEVEPVPALLSELLRGITSSRLPERPRSAGQTSVVGAGANATVAAERARRAAWWSGAEAAWSPALSIGALRLTASSAVVISHNNHLVLTALADSPTRGDHGTEDEQLAAAATSAAAARHAWLQVARALAGFTTDTRSHVGPAAAESSELALWIGRLAYTDPQWTLSRGTRALGRPGGELAPDREHLRAVVGAAHQASHALSYVAAASQRQVQTASRARRILVPVSSIPDTFDFRVPFTPAPAERVRALLDLYGSAAEASTDAARRIADLAVEMEAPSRALAAAAEITDRAIEPRRQTAVKPSEVLAALHHAEAGPIERMLRDLEVEDSSLLGRAAELDSASQNLVIEASERLGRGDLTRHAAEVPARFGAATIVKWSLGSSIGKKVAARPESDHAVRPEPEH